MRRFKLELNDRRGFFNPNFAEDFMFDWMDLTSFSSVVFMTSADLQKKDQSVTEIFEMQII